LTDPHCARFGKIAGSSLLVSVVYCMVVLQPSMFGALYITWVDAIQGKLGKKGHVA
jgi:hypothetical protein